MKHHKVHLWETAITRITHHPQAMCLWHLAHNIMVGDQ